MTSTIPSQHQTTLNEITTQLQSIIHNKSLARHPRSTASSSSSSKSITMNQHLQPYIPLLLQYSSYILTYPNIVYKILTRYNIITEPSLSALILLYVDALRDHNGKQH